jgi:hypothetical protein
MPNTIRIEAEAARGQRMLEQHSRYLEDQYREWRRDPARMFQSCEPGGRGAVSPLGNVCRDWRWSGVGRPEGRKP